jgi:hypothetical protein
VSTELYEVFSVENFKQADDIAKILILYFKLNFYMAEGKGKVHFRKSHEGP